MQSNVNKKAKEATDVPTQVNTDSAKAYRTVDIKGKPYTRKISITVNVAYNVTVPTTVDCTKSGPSCGVLPPASGGVM